MTGRRRPAGKPLPVTQDYHFRGCNRRDGGCGCPWSVRIPEQQPDGTTRRRKHKFGTYAEAKAFYLAWQAKRAAGLPSPVVDRATTVGAYLDRWLEMLVLRGLADTYVAGVTSNVKHIRRRLGGRVVTSVTGDDVIRFRKQMVDAGVGPEARRRALQNLHAMYGYWERQPPGGDGRYLPHGNPVRMDLEVKPERREYDPLSWEEVEKAAANMPFGNEATMVRIGYLFGFRVGELTALRVEDLEVPGRDRDAGDGTLAADLADVAWLDEDAYARRPVRINSVRQRYANGNVRDTKEHKRRRHILNQQLARELAATLAAYPPRGGWLFINPSPYAGKWTGEVKLADVARAAGVANHTVTLAMAIEAGKDWPSRNAARLSQRTQRRIVAAAAELGWPRADPYSYQTFSAHFAKAFKAAGVALPDGQVTHAMRHGCISRLAAEGKMPAEIAAFIKDGIDTVLAVYLHVRRDRMDAIELGLQPRKPGGRP